MSPRRCEYPHITSRFVNVQYRYMWTRTAGELAPLLIRSQILKVFKKWKSATGGPRLCFRLDRLNVFFLWSVVYKR